MSFNTIHENKILTKISESTVSFILGLIKALCDSYRLYVEIFHEL